MKVSNQNPNSAAGTKAGKTNQSSAEQASGAKAQKSALSAADLKGSAQVDLSPKARQVQKAKELATPSQDVDEAKVARLQKMIDEGKYNVDAESVADRMVDEHLFMA